MGYFLNYLQQPEDLKLATTRTNLPIPDGYTAEAPRKITAEEHEFQAFKTLRNERASARHEGARKARAAKVSSLPDVYVSITHNNLSITERRGGGCKEEVESLYPVFCWLLLYMPYVHVFFPYGDQALRPCSRESDPRLEKP